MGQDTVLHVYGFWGLTFVWFTTYNIHFSLLHDHDTTVRLIVIVLDVVVFITVLHLLFVVM